MFPERAAVNTVPPTFVKYWQLSECKGGERERGGLASAPLFSATTAKWALSAFMSLEEAEPSKDACQMVPLS